MIVNSLIAVPILLEKIEEIKKIRDTTDNANIKQDCEIVKFHLIDVLEQVIDKSVYKLENKNK